MSRDRIRKGSFSLMAWIYCLLDQLRILSPFSGLVASVRAFLFRPVPSADLFRNSLRSLSYLLVFSHLHYCLGCVVFFVFHFSWYVVCFWL